MKLKKVIGTMAALLFMPAATAGETLELTQADAIARAQQHSPEAQAARHTYLAAYWNYRFYRANYLPSVTLSASPELNHQINRITQSDGTERFLNQNQLLHVYARIHAEPEIYKEIEIPRSSNLDESEIAEQTTLLERIVVQ